MSLSKYHLAAVIWDDAHHSLDEFSKEEIGRQFHKAARETNYGLLVEDDEAGVTIAMEEGADGQFRHPFFIPRQMIIEVIDLGIPRRKIKRKQKIRPETQRAPNPE
jgi:hypothetical protein